MELSGNLFKQALKERRLQIGLWSSLASNIGAEIISDSGFDWILLDTEHSPNEVPTLLSQLQALARGTATPVIRPAWNDPVLIKRVLDIGTQSVLLPYVQNPDEARRAVAAVRYPPAGIRGVAATPRASRYGRVNDYLKKANEEICVLVQVETRTALDQLEAIAAVEGVDGVFIGPADLSASLGHVGNPQHPEAQKAIESAAARLKTVGKAAGILTGNEDEARRYIGRGYTFVAVGTDTVLLARTADALAKKVQGVRTVMPARNFEYRYRGPRNTPEERGGKPPVYNRTLENEHAMIIERDLAVTLRDGVKVYVNVYRPADERPVPPIIAWSPYGKHVPFDPRRFLNAGVKQGDTSQYTAFEAPDPVFWVPNGYAVVNVDIRGTWYSEGTAHFLAPEEAQDFYDLVEWAGTQPWSNGKVGLSGVSYLAQLQWRVAELNPPHLAAINPWEGWTDSYREVATHGGIPDTHFWPALWNRWGASKGKIEDLETETREHPLIDDFWRSKAADFSKIKAPALVVASWTDQGLHTRGTFEGFKHIASPQKWLIAHGQKKWAHYYVPENVRRLRTFFDHFLKGIDNEVKNWPKVQVEVRERNGVGTFRAEKEWPLARTQYTKLYLNAADGTLRKDAVRDAASVAYDPVCRDTDPADHAQFDITFERDTELTGYMKLRVFMSAEGADDLDVFVGLHKLDRDGQFVPMAYYAQFDDGPIALGWLRASHRELDPARSTDWQPVHTHTREEKLKPGEVVPLDIEIWPSSTRFAAGEKLRLIVQGTDINRYPKDKAPVYFRHEASVNKGRHVIHAGGRYESYLLVPVIP